MSVLVHSQHEQYCILKVFRDCSFSLAVLLNYKDSTEIQGLPSTNCNFQDFFSGFLFSHGLSRCVQTLTETLNILVYIFL